MKESKYVTIYKEWKEKIESGQIAEGERLPTESSLMESYQVSRYCPQVPESSGAERIYSERKRTGVAGNAKTEVYVPAF